MKTKITFLAAALLLNVVVAQAANRTRCQMPADQGYGSLQGAWESLPIHVSLDQRFYGENDGSDATAIKKAISTWNNWAALKGKVAFVIENDGVGQEIPAISGCSQSEYSSANPQTVGIWKIPSSGAGQNARASCGEQKKILAPGVPSQTDWMIEGGKIKAASVLLNFDEFNKGGPADIDLESNALHELGHVLGMLHSCNGSGEDSADGTSAPLCSVAPPHYLTAVMFPYLRGSEMRRELGQNDFDRVNCLY